jgi:hypothetical protein
MEPPKEIRNCTVKFKCPQLWKQLATTDDPKVRYCDQCLEHVYLVQSEEELAEQSALGRCVAILNLSPEHSAYSVVCLLGEIEPDRTVSDDFEKDEDDTD